VTALLTRVRDSYRRAAILLLNTVVAFVALNLLAAAILAVSATMAARTHRDLPTVEYAGLERLVKAYPGWAREDLVALLTETEQTRRFEYAPFTAFRTPACSGRYVNVSAAGYRLVRDQGPWPPDPAATNVFLFGGSTAYGFGLADADTLASQLQARLRAAPVRQPVNVYNFASPAYFSTQERILFEQLLLFGTVPDAAVFVDGLNDVNFADHRTPPYVWSDAKAGTLRQLVEQHHRREDLSLGLLAAARALPVSRLLWRSFGSLLPGPQVAAYDTGSAEQVVRRWFRHRDLVRATAASNGVYPLFVWQPVPFYHYDLRCHLFAPELFLKRPEAYERMRQEHAAGRTGTDFLWLGDMQSGRCENFYVDEWHYTVAFTGEIAAAIQDALLKGRLLEHRGRSE
jgi:hypothetical protein